MILLAFSASFMLYLLALQAREEWKRACRWTVQIDHATKIFPHPNEKARPWMRRK
jgi:hypothetical protein